jgi:hypothetical protein
LLDPVSARGGRHADSGFFLRLNPD